MFKTWNDWEDSGLLQEKLQEDLEELRNSVRCDEQLLSELGFYKLYLAVENKKEKVDLNLWNVVTPNEFRIEIRQCRHESLKWWNSHLIMILNS